MTTKRKLSKETMRARAARAVDASIMVAPDRVPAPQTIVCAPDSFKGSLSAVEAAEAMARGARTALQAAKAAPEDFAIRLVPLADGGEGTVDALVRARTGERRTTEVLGPLGEPRRAAWGLLEQGATAVIEMAEAAGLTLVPPERRNPLHTTTFGVGQLLAAAAQAVAAPPAGPAAPPRRILIGIGGSATTDGGIGMAQALGFRLLDADGALLPAPATGADLDRLARIEPPPPGSPAAATLERLRTLDLLVACDVRNPLVGPRGSAAVYGPQKGASPAEVARLDAGLARLAEIWAACGFGAHHAQAEGGGAAGGLGAGLTAFLGARRVSGIDLLLDLTDFSALVNGAFLVITGEGSLNAQTLEGKAVAGVARRCATAGVPLAVLVGSRAEAPALARLHEAGIHAVFPIAPAPATEAESIAHCAAWIEAAAAQVVSLALAMRRASLPV